MHGVAVLLTLSVRNSSRMTRYRGNIVIGPKGQRDGISERTARRRPGLALPDTPASTTLSSPPFLPAITLRTFSNVIVVGSTGPRPAADPSLASPDSVSPASLLSSARCALRSAQQPWSFLAAANNLASVTVLQ